ncbi:MAG: DUF2911 domain-containing protein [Thermoanaerobaculia bacterium]|nr:MAG: DUF2911 domain-containing protein [Thermoanaerobaculia bacterium]
MRKTLLSLAAAPALVALAGLALTSLAPGSWIADWAPCPRNWGWGPAWKPRASPLEALAFELGESGHGKLCYGRPSLRGRVMLGSPAVPFGRLWRTGANEPTTLHLDAPARIADLHLAPGSYSIYTVPDAVAWEVVVNRSTRQWGLESEYTDEVRAREVGRFRVPVEVLESPVETLTFRAVPTAAGAVVLVLEWQTTRIRMPLDAELAVEPPSD